MATEAEVNAHRANAQKSTGPRTAEGKAAVAQNALTHGLMARAAVLQGEEWEEYTSFREGMLQELYPDGVQQEELAARIVGLYRRLRRAERYQNAVFEALYDQYAAEQVQTPVPTDPVPAVASDPVLGRMLVADFSGARVCRSVEGAEPPPPAGRACRIRWRRSLLRHSGTPRPSAKTGDRSHRTGDF